MKILIYLVLWAAAVTRITALIGYDCGQKFTNFTTYSLVDIGQCDLPSPIINETRVEATVLQINDYSLTPVRYCKILIKRTALYCTFNHHVAAVKNGEIEYIKEVTREECDQLHIHRTARINDNIINNLAMNATTYKSLTLAGRQEFTGHCYPVDTYSDPFGEFYNVIVQGYVEIRLEERWNAIDLNNNKIKLEYGTTCTFSDGHCIDSSLGYAFWNIIPLHVCQEEKYTNLYTGPITKLVERESVYRPLYVLESDQMSFAFKDMGETILCSFKLIKTEHPKLFILLDTSQSKFAARKVKIAQDLDIFAYVNSKFLYVEKHARRQMYQLYQDVLLQQCELERKVIGNALSLATIAPDLFAYQLMGGPGYMSLLAGEVVHVLKCIPVEVRTRELEDCYQELPVMKADKPMFLAPRTHILREFGSPTICDRNLPVAFRFGSSWIKTMPKITSHEEPETIKPQTKQTWRYKDPADLATTGLYTYVDLENLKTYIMFPNERNAVLNQLALGVTGKSPVNGGISITRMLDEDALSRIAESTWDKMWGRFVTFGSASAAFLTILIIFRLIKFSLDTIIHGYALHNLYGWSIHLLGALWNSLTHLLLYLGRAPTSEQERESDEGRAAYPNPTAPTASETPGVPPRKKSVIVETAAIGNDTYLINSRVVENKLYPRIDEPSISSLPLRGRNDNLNV